MRERKCRNCKLTYKGLKDHCPFCHKLTKIGYINKVMSFFGYLFFFIILVFFAYYILFDTVVKSILLAPLIVTLIVIAVIIGLLYLIFK